MPDDIAKLIENKNYAAVEDRWMEMMEAGHTVDEFVSIGQALKKAGEPSKAMVLMELLTEDFESKHDFQSAINACKNTIYFVTDDKKLRSRIAGLYRKAHPASLNLDKYIEVSGLKRGDTFFKMLQKLNELLVFDVGNYFFFENYGLGIVTEVIIPKREIVFDFEKKGRHFLDFDVARKLLIPVTVESFLYKRAKTPEQLRQMASADPVALVLLILKGANLPLSTGQIKSYLESILDKDEASRIWEKGRRHLETSPNIRISGKAQKTYQYVASGIDKDEEAITAFDRADLKGKYALAEEYARKKNALFAQVAPRLAKAIDQAWDRDPGLALDVVLLFQEHKTSASLGFNAETILLQHKPEIIIHKLSSVDHQRHLLGLIKTQHPEDWTLVFKKLILTSREPALFGEIEKHLRAQPEALKDVLQTIFMLLPNYAEQYQWLLKKMSRGELTEYRSPAYALRIINSLDQVKGIRSLVHKILDLETFDRLLGTASGDEASRILAAVDASESLAEHEKKDYRRIIQHHFPQMFKKEEEVIYATKAALTRKREELSRVLDVEIDENKKDISRAREFGDLSENFEYKVAKEKQDQLYQKVRDLETALGKARLIESDQVDTSRVSVGTRVGLKNSETGAVITYAILGRWDTDLEKNIISNEAPLAKSLLGKTVGQTVRISDVGYEIVGIGKAGS